MTKKLIMFFLVALILDVSKAQNVNHSIYPEVGKPCPEFILHNISYYKKQSATLKDFRGKWLLLDFWNLNCGACIASFPRLSKMQNDYRDQLQIVLIGMPDVEGKIREVYARYREREKLGMPSAFDNTLFRQFQYGGELPKSVLIDDKGIVRCLTTSIHAEDMKAFLEGKHPDLPRSYRDNEDEPEEANHLMNYDGLKPFAINNNGGLDSDFLFRSILTKWNPGIQKKTENTSNLFGIANRPVHRNISIAKLGVSAEDLYRLAFSGYEDLRNENLYGQWYDKLILEIKDSALFKPDYKNGANIFCYSLDLPKNINTPKENVDPIEKRAMTIMQNDLSNYFGYHVSVEIRKIHCWMITADRTAKIKLQVKGDSTREEEIPRVSLKVWNVPWRDIVRKLRENFPTEFIFDETGITGNVDLKLDCKGCLPLNNIEDLKKALKEIGLDLVASQREMKAIVVHD